MVTSSRLKCVSFIRYLIRGNDRVDPLKSCSSSNDEKGYLLPDGDASVILISKRVDFHMRADHD